MGQLQLILAKQLILHGRQGMKLFSYELQKISFQKVGLVLIVILWVLSQFLFFGRLEHTRTLNGYQEEWERFYDEIEHKTYAEAAEWTATEYVRLLQDSNTFQENYPYYLILLQEKDHFSYLSGYPGYLQDITAQMEGMLNSPVFRGSSFAIDNMKKTEEAFAAMEGVDLSFAAPERLPDALSDRAGMILLTIQVMILAVLIFGAEQNSDKKLLLTMQYRGRIPTAAAKTACMIAGSILLVLLMYGSFLLQAASAMGGRDWSASIQSLQEMKRCTWRVDCREFIFFFLLHKALGMIFFGLATGACICLAQNIGGILIFAVVLLSAMAARSFLPETADWLWIKNINPIVWADTWEWMHEYLNMSIFGHAVSVKAGFYMGMALGIPGLSVAILMLFPKNGHSRRFPLLDKVLRLLRKASAHFAQSVSIFWQHFYQMFFYGKRYLLLLAAAAVLLAAGNLREDSGFYYLEKATYDSYMNTIQGPYTEETRLFLEKEEAHLSGADGYADELFHKKEAGELTEKEYATLLYELEKEQLQKSDGFRIVSEQWADVRNVASSETGMAGFFQIYLEEELFCINWRGYLLLGLVFVTILLFIGPYSRIEAQSRELLMTAFRGRRQRTLVQLMFHLIVSLLLGAGIYFMWYRSVFAGYVPQDYSLSAACLSVFRTLDPKITVGEVLLLCWLAKILGLTLLAVLVTIFSMWKLDTVSYYVLLSVTIGVPLLLCILNVPAQWFSLMGFFRLEDLLSQSFWGSIAYLIVWTVAIIILFFCMFHRMLHAGEGREAPLNSKGTKSAQDKARRT